MRVFSNESTALAYDGTPEIAELPKGVESRRVVIQPGDNVVSDEDAAVLGADAHFKRHLESGVHVILTDEGKPEDKAADAPKPAKGKGKSKASELPPDVAKEVEDFKALSPDEQEAMHLALSDEAKAVLEAEKAGA